MQTNNGQSLLITLKTMVASLNHLQQLLDADRESFSKNNMTEIEASNAKKSELLEKIVYLITQINHPNSSLSFLQKIEENMVGFDQALRNDIDKTMVQLKEEITACARHLNVNSNIVYVGLEQTRALWEALLGSKPNLDCVYDSKGNTQK